MATENKSHEAEDEAAAGPMYYENYVPPRTSDEWQRQFHKLLFFKSRFGHTEVPDNFIFDPQLGEWVKMVRRLRKKMEKGRPSYPLTPERAMQLQEIGFKWWTKFSGQVPWSQRYDELKAFITRYGHAMVPLGWEENEALANWVSSQRREYKRYTAGEKSSLTDERVKLLNDINFVWKAPRGGSLKRLSQEFCDAFGNKDAKTQKPRGDNETGRDEHRNSKPAAKSMVHGSRADASVDRTPSPEEETAGERAERPHEASSAASDSPRGASRPTLQHSSPTATNNDNLFTRADRASLSSAARAPAAPGASLTSLGIVDPVAMAAALQGNPSLHASLQSLAAPSVLPQLGGLDALGVLQQSNLRPLYSYGINDILSLQTASLGGPRVSSLVDGVIPPGYRLCMVPESLLQQQQSAHQPHKYREDDDSSDDTDSSEERYRRKKRKRKHRRKSKKKKKRRKSRRDSEEKGNESSISSTTKSDSE